MLGANGPDDAFCKFISLEEKLLGLLMALKAGAYILNERNRWQAESSRDSLEVFPKHLYVSPTLFVLFVLNVFSIVFQWFPTVSSHVHLKGK